MRASIVCAITPSRPFFYFGRVDHEVDDIIDKPLIHCKTGRKLRKELKKVAPIGRTEKGPEAIILVRANWTCCGGRRL